MGGFPWYLGRRRITLSVPLEGDPVKARVACTEKGCYMEVKVTVSHFFIGGLISHLWKILEYCCLVDLF
jgi:hypothetical protein